MANLRDLMKKHWGISTIMVVCVLLGSILGFSLLPDGWHPIRKIVGGSLGGAVCALFMVAHRLIEGAGAQAITSEDLPSEEPQKSTDSAPQKR